MAIWDQLFTLPRHSHAHGTSHYPLSLEWLVRSGSPNTSWDLRHTETWSEDSVSPKLVFLESTVNLQGTGTTVQSVIIRVWLGHKVWRNPFDLDQMGS